MDLSGFRVFDFTDGVPYFSITKNGVTFSRAVTRKLGCPSFARLLINYDTKQVALQACEEGTPLSMQFYRPKENDVYSVRWNHKDLIATLGRLMETNFEEHGFRVEGVPIDEQTMLFDMKKAKPLD